MHVFAYMVYICVCFCVFEAESVELHALREHQAILLHHDIIVHDVKGAGGRVCDIMYMQTIEKDMMIWRGGERC